MVRAITVQPVYNGFVYIGHPAYYGHLTTSQNFQLPYIFCKVDLYIAVTLPFPKNDSCTQVWLYTVWKAMYFFLSIFVFSVIIAYTL